MLWAQPPLWIFLQALSDDAFNERVNASDNVGRIGWRLGLLLSDQIDYVVGDECLFACEDLVKQQAERVDIALQGNFFAVDLFGRHVCRRADSGFGTLNFHL